MVVGLTPALVRAEDPTSAPCTTANCTSGVFVNLQNLSQLRGASRVTICVDSRCRRFRTPRVARFIDANLRTGRVSVKVVVYGRHGQVLLRLVKRVALRKSQPNGANCPPTCWSRRLKLDAEHRRLRVVD
jgi:hypothetical protein